MSDTQTKRYLVLSRIGNLAIFLDVVKFLDIEMHSTNFFANRYRWSQRVFAPSTWRCKNLPTREMIISFTTYSLGATTHTPKNSITSLKCTLSYIIDRKWKMEIESAFYKSSTLSRRGPRCTYEGRDPPHFYRTLFDSPMYLENEYTRQITTLTILSGRNSRENYQSSIGDTVSGPTSNLAYVSLHWKHIDHCIASLHILPRNISCLRILHKFGSVIFFVPVPTKCLALRAVHSGCLSHLPRGGAQKILEKSSRNYVKKYDLSWQRTMPMAAHSVSIILGRSSAHAVNRAQLPAT